MVRGVANGARRDLDFGRQFQETVRHARIEDVAVGHLSRGQLQVQRLRIVAQRVERGRRQEDRRQVAEIHVEGAEQRIAAVVLAAQIVLVEAPHDVEAEAVAAVSVSRGGGPGRIAVFRHMAVAAVEQQPRPERLAPPVQHGERQVGPRGIAAYRQP